MAVIDTLNGEDLVVSALGRDTVTVAVHCREFGRISHVRLSHEHAVELASALTGLVLDHGAAALEEA
jgi:hypothetical protein